MYMITTYSYRFTKHVQRMYFPVRSEFFYDHPLGPLVNGVMSFLSMYPPVFRAPEKRGVTRAGLDFLARELARPGTVVGMHPEGTRGKGDDPYELLKPEPGFGRVVLESMPVVIPIFINGMGNDFVHECKSTLDGTGYPIFMVFGEPVDLAEFAGADPHRLRAQVDVGRKVMAAIAALAERERGLRAAL
jgi:1-acyl-sn-glycerol-3-phosphate acyltransferase